MACWLAQFDAKRGTFRTWVLTAARNRATNWLRAYRPELGADLESALDPREPADLHEELERAFAALPADQRSVFHLAEVEQLSHEEIARIEGCAIGTVKSRLHRARRRLRELLAEPGRSR